MVRKITSFYLLSGIALSALTYVGSASGAEIDMNMAQMQAMDKITGKVSLIEVPVNGIAQFGSFSILVRACKTTPPEDTPENFAFVDVVDTYNNKTPLNIFRGWMISSSPALNPVEHPIYDVWLLKCVNATVDPSQLLSKEQLDARDAIAKAPKFSDDDKLKVNEEATVSVSDTSSDTLLSEETSQKVETVINQNEKTGTDTELKSQPISNPPAVSNPEDRNSPVGEAEDGSPQSLLNIGQDFVPQETPAEEQKAETLPESAEALPKEKTPELDQEQNSDSTLGFLENILPFSGEKEENPSALSSDKESQKADTIDVNEIDKELSQLQ